MQRLIFQFIISLIAVYLSALLLKGFVWNGAQGLLTGAAVLAVLIVLVRPVITVVALPLNLLTFGLFGLIINTWLIQITDLVSGSLGTAGFWTAFEAAVILWVVEWFMKYLLSVFHKADSPELV